MSENHTKFPQIHIATSVVNRLLNLRDSIQPPTVVTPAPAVKDPTLEGGAIDAATQTPTPPVAPSDDVSGAVDAGIVGTLTQ